MYEVYNNALKLGGKLNVIFDRYIVEHNDRIFIEATRGITPKLFRRRNMSDITARIGVVVMSSISYLTLSFSEPNWLILLLLPFFQLPGYERFDTREDMITFLFTNENPAVDTFPRFPVHVLFPIIEMLQCKWVFFNAHKIVLRVLASW